MRRKTLPLPAPATLAAGAILLLTPGCARTPGGITSNAGRQLVVTMKVAGTINPSDQYYVVFNASNQTSVGPIPPIGPNWGGNGFVTGTATSFVEYTGSFTGAGYQLGTLSGVNDNLQSQLTGVAPTNSEPIVDGSAELSFTIPLAELLPAGASADSVKYLNVNFINTNVPGTATAPPQIPPKLFDALGNTAGGDFTSFVTIPTTQDGSYGNTTTGAAIEPSTPDVAVTTGEGTPTATSDPDASSLDIRDWSIQVTG